MRTNVFTSCFGLLAVFALAFIFTACADPTSDVTAKDLTGTVTIQKDGTDITAAEMGDELKAVVKASNAGTFKYQWQKKTGTADFTNIPSATSITYRIATPVAVYDEIRVVVTATGFSGRIVSSNKVLVDDPNAPPLTGDITIARVPEGTPVRIGDTVKATPSGLNEDVIPVYQWQKKTDADGDFTNIPNANSATYLIDESEVTAGDYIRVYVRANYYSGGIESNEIQVEIAPALTGTVTVQKNGTTVTDVDEGETVNAVVTSPASQTALKYQWQKKTGTGDFTNIPSANSAAYRIATPVVPNDIIKVVVSAVNFSESIESATVLVNTPPPPVIENIVITSGRPSIIPFDGDTKVGKGRTLQFYAEVSGQHLTVEDEEVTWSVAGPGATATGTGIDADGLLTAALTESNTTLTVTARSKTDTEVTKTMDIKVVAVHTVTFDTDGGTPVVSRVIEVVSDNVAVVEAGETMSLFVGSIGWSYVSEKEGYLFNGWYNTAGPTQTPIYSIPSISANITLKAIWETPYWVTLDLKGGILVDKVGEPLPLIYPILPGGTFAPHAFSPTKDGEVFYGWYFSDDQDQKVITGPLTGWNAGNTTMEITKDTTFCAKWGEGILFTLDLNGGEYPPDVPTVYRYAPRYKVYLEEFINPTHPEELAFRGWARSTNLDYVYGRFEIIQIPAEDTTPITLVAQWAEGTVITLNLNGGEFPLPYTQIPIPTTYVRASGTTFNVPPTNPVKEDYSFTGWFRDAELTDVLPQEGIIVGNDPITIYAGWLDLRNLGVYKGTNGDAVIIEKTNAGIVVATFTESSCGVWFLEGAGFLTIVDVDTITVRPPNSIYPSTFTRVTATKQPAGIAFGAPLFAEWKQSTTLGGMIFINLRDWDGDGSATFTWDNQDYIGDNNIIISIPICYVVEDDTLYLLRRYGPASGRLPGEVIWGIPIVNNALQGWTK